MRTHIGCMTSKFAWQLSDSIWITYWTIGHLGSLEVWYLINHLNCLNFISIAYLINFGSNAEKCGGSRGVKLYWFIFSGPKCSPMQGGLWWNWYLGKRAHPIANWWVKKDLAQGIPISIDNLFWLNSSLFLKILYFQDLEYENMPC